MGRQALSQQLLSTGVEIPPGGRRLDRKAVVPQVVGDLAIGVGAGVGAKRAAIAGPNQRRRRSAGRITRRAWRRRLSNRCRQLSPRSQALVPLRVASAREIVSKGGGSAVPAPWHPAPHHHHSADCAPRPAAGVRYPVDPGAGSTGRSVRCQCSDAPGRRAGVGCLRSPRRGVGSAALVAHHRKCHGMGGNANDSALGQLKTAGGHHGVAVITRGRRSLHAPSQQELALDEGSAADLQRDPCAAVGPPFPFCLLRHQRRERELQRGAGRHVDPQG